MAGAGGSVGAVRPDAGRRLRRLLAVLAYLARRGRASLAELSEQFGMPADELVADLELAACCGLPPYTPDQLLEIVVGEDEVVAHLGPELARPRQLSPAEGFALAAAARAVAAVPGADPDGALARALAKLEAALGAHQALHVELDEPEHLRELRAAVDGGRQVELEYYSASRDETTTRVVDPLRLTNTAGHWYLAGWCHRAGGLRSFRVDRVMGCRPTGRPAGHAGVLEAAGAAEGARSIATAEPAPAAGTGPPGSPFAPGPDDPVARVVVDEAGAWLADTVPNLGATVLADGRMEVTLAVASEVWFGRLLLRLGPHAQVLAPPELADAGARAARAVLARYRTSPPPRRTRPRRDRRRG